MAALSYTQTSAIDETTQTLAVDVDDAGTVTLTRDVLDRLLAGIGFLPDDTHPDNVGDPSV